MPPAPDGRDDVALRAALARGLDRPAAEGAQRLAASLAQTFGPAAAALVHYGSHAQDSGAGESSGSSRACISAALCQRLAGRFSSARMITRASC